MKYKKTKNAGTPPPIRRTGAGRPIEKNSLLNQIRKMDTFDCLTITGKSSKAVSATASVVSSEDATKKFATRASEDGETVKVWRTA